MIQKVLESLDSTKRIRMSDEKGLFRKKFGRGSRAEHGSFRIKGLSRFGTARAVWLSCGDPYGT